MSFHSSDPSCRFRSFEEAERHCEHVVPIRKWYAKRMCSACRRRQVYGKAKVLRTSGVHSEAGLKGKRWQFRPFNAKHLRGIISEFRCHHTGISNSGH